VNEPLLEIEDLSTRFPTEAGHEVRAVDGVSLRVARGEIVGLVGESGSGKSVLSFSVLGLVPKPGRIAGGRIRLEGVDLTALPERALRALRGNRVAMIFQDPMTSLNPYLRLEEQLGEVAQLHLGLGRAAARERSVEMLARVGLPDPAARVRAWPHQLSGGMRQRAMVAMALLCDPALLLADEPTTALDVTIQAQILALLRGLRDERGMSVLLITHDLGVVAGTCERTYVMYAGRILEEGPTRALFARPEHPYTRALLASVPRVGLAGGGAARLASIPGLPPRLDAGPFRACRFEPRCAFAREVCRAAEPTLERGGPHGERARRCAVPANEVAEA
jgi:oligopeptide/dipeptide ABC transporter ATP-binding protein